jgi:predicted RNase H-like HicB family nuclease
MDVCYQAVITHDPRRSHGGQYIAHIDELMCNGVGESPDEAIRDAVRKGAATIEDVFSRHSTPPPRPNDKMLVPVSVPRPCHLSVIAGAGGSPEASLTGAGEGEGGGPQAECLASGSDPDGHLGSLSRAVDDEDGMLVPLPPEAPRGGLLGRWRTRQPHG